jgi:hypothetical protein
VNAKQLVSLLFTNFQKPGIFMNHQISTVRSSALKRIAVFIEVLVIIPAALSNALAGETCYSEEPLPSISKLDETENGIMVTLGGFYVERKLRKSPVIYWNEEKGWMAKLEDNVKCISCDSKQIDELKRMIPRIEPIPIEDQEAEEAPSIPVYYDGHIWFGIDFYLGEGYAGTGGIGRFTPATKQLEIHRPAELKRVQIQKVVHDGEHLWAATKYVVECDGTPPALGLLKYDWSSKTLSQFKSIKDGPCGFVINDLTWKNGSLWVATDIGLSRWIKENNQWLHYLPDKNDPSQVSTMSCPEIYTFLFNEFAATKSWCDAGNTCDKVLLDNLKRFRPDYYESIKGASEPINRDQ